MGKLTSEERQKWHNDGERDASTGDVPLIKGLWKGIFESDEHYEDRNSAYYEGVANHHNQK